MTAAPARFATFRGAEPPLDDQGVFGRDVAVDGFMDALLRHGPDGRYLVFRNPDPLAPAAAPARGVRPPRPGVCVEEVEIARLRRSFADFPFRAWHDCDGDLQLGVDLRASYARRPFPVTATPHVLSYAGLPHHWILRLLLGPVLPCDSLVCTSRAARRALEKLFARAAGRLARAHGVEPAFRGRLDVIPLGVDTGVFRPGGRDEARRALGLDPRALVIGYVGRVSFRDKADLLPLVQAFGRLAQPEGEGPLLLLIAGTGPDSAPLVREHAAALGLGERVRHLDPLPAERRHLAHAALDVFVSPADSVQETFGLTPVEAMASGVPQVVSDWSGYRDTVEDGVTGFRVPTLWARADRDVCLASGVYDEWDLRDHLQLAQSVAVDVDALTAALQRLAGAPGLRLRMGEASRRRALERFAWPVVIARYVELWRELEEIAAGQPELPPPEDRYGIQAFVEVFGHYATEILPPSARLALSPAGGRVLRGDEPLPLYLEPFGLFDRDALLRALELLESGGPRELDELARDLGAGGGDAAVRHVMWLLKQGLVRRAA